MYGRPDDHQHLDSMVMSAAFGCYSFAPRFTLESLDHVEELAPSMEIMIVKIEAFLTIRQCETLFGS